MILTRLSAFSGDQLLSANMVAIVGTEVWRYRELADDTAQVHKQGVLWESITSLSLVLAGVKQVLVLRPESAELCKRFFSRLGGVAS